MFFEISVFLQCKTLSWYVCNMYRNMYVYMYVGTYRIMYRVQ